MIGIIGKTHGVTSDTNPQNAAANSSPANPPWTTTGVRSIFARRARSRASYSSGGTGGLAAMPAGASAGLAAGGDGGAASRGGGDGPRVGGAVSGCGAASPSALLTSPAYFGSTGTAGPASTSTAADGGSRTSVKKQLAWLHAWSRVPRPRATVFGPGVAFGETTAFSSQVTGSG